MKTPRHARQGDTVHFECGNGCGDKNMGTELGMMWWYDMVRSSHNIHYRTSITEHLCSQQPLPNSHGRNSHQVEPAALKVCWAQNESRTGNHEAFRPASALCFGRESNPYGHCCPQDFKSCVSTNSTTKAKRVQKYLNFT